MISYSVVRSKRKSIAIYVKDGNVLVKAPLRTDRAVIDAFVAGKQNWIARKLQDGIVRRSAYADVLSGKSFLYLGKRLQMIQTQRKSFALQDGVLAVPTIYYIDGAVQLSETASAALKRFYRRLAGNYLENRLREIASAYGVSYGKFALTNAKGKWGSCDTYNNIRLNWHLIFLSPALIDYVIVHELVHTIVHNHSRDFWQRVAQLYPSYKEAIACLKEVGVLIELYL